MKNFFMIFSIAMVFFILSLSLLFVGCENSIKATTDKNQMEETEKLTAEAQRQVGMPNIKSFQQRKIMKLIYEQCDREDLICYAYILASYSGKLVFIGKCIGYGVPFSAQFTNPEKIVNAEEIIGNTNHAGLFTEVLPQPDPNGLFMPTSSSATWLLMVDPETKKTRPVYLEPEIVVSPFPLHKIEKKK